MQFSHGTQKQSPSFVAAPVVANRLLYFLTSSSFPPPPPIFAKIGEVKKPHVLAMFPSKAARRRRGRERESCCKSLFDAASYSFSHRSSLFFLHGVLLLSFFLSFSSPACMAKSYLSFPLTARGVAVAVAKRFLEPQPYLMKEVRAPAEDPRKSAIYWPFAVSDYIPPKKKKNQKKELAHAATPLCFPLPFCDQLSVCPRDLWFCLERAAKKSGLKSELILSLV